MKNLSNSTAEESKRTSSQPSAGPSWGVFNGKKLLATFYDKLTAEAFKARYASFLSRYPINVKTL